jgi:hypothetical protein
METRNPTGYCPRCRQEVLLTREEINWGVAILLLCFTGGIGLIIYLAIYYSKPQDRCVHCNTRVISRAPQYSRNINLYQNAAAVSNENQNVKVIENGSPKYCPFCGEHLESSNVRSCPNCGTKV